MRNIRYIFRLTIAFISRFKIIIILGVVVGVIITFSFNIILERFAPKQITRIGLSGRYTTENLPPEILNMISDGLTTIKEDGSVEPSLAREWTISDEGRTWTFKLREDVMWHDGSPLTSTDIDYSFDDVNTDILNDDSIQFQLKDPFAPFPAVVNTPLFKRGLLGTDEWKVEEIKFSENAISEIELINSEGQIIMYNFYPTEQRSKVAYKLGEVDQVINLFDPAPFDEWSNSNVTAEINNDQVVTLFYNTSDSFLSDKTIRQALNYAIDKEKLGSQRAIGPINKNSWAYNPTVKTYDYDLERATDVFKEITDGGGQPIIELVSAPALLDTAERIKDDWEAAGMEVTIQVSAIIPNDFQAFLAIFELPDDPDQYSIWHSTQTDTNISAYTNPRIDKLLEDGRTELDLEQRKRIYLDFQRFLLEDSPAAFLYYPETYSVKRK